jgi:hypothetical protein
MNIEKLKRGNKSKMKKMEVRIDRMRFRPRAGIYFLQLKRELGGARLIECNALYAFTLQ